MYEANFKLTPKEYKPEHFPNQKKLFTYKCVHLLKKVA